MMVIVTVSAVDVAPSSSVTTREKIWVTALSFDVSELSVKVGWEAVAELSVALPAVPVPPVLVQVNEAIVPSLSVEPVPSRVTWVPDVTA